MSEKNAPEIIVKIKADPASLMITVQEACKIGAREGAKKTMIKLSKLSFNY